MNHSQTNPWWYTWQLFIYSWMGGHLRKVETCWIYTNWWFNTGNIWKQQKRCCGIIFLHCVCDPCLIHVWWLKWTNCSSLLFSPVWICVKIVLPKIVHWFIIIMFSIKVAIWAVYPILRDTLPQYSWLDHVRSKNCFLNPDSISRQYPIVLPLFCPIENRAYPRFIRWAFLDFIQWHQGQRSLGGAPCCRNWRGGGTAMAGRLPCDQCIESLSLWKLTLLSYTAYDILTHLCLEHMAVLTAKLWW